MSPPLPGCHSGLLGWARRPSTWVHVSPPSALRKRPAGSTPAYTTPGAAVTFHTRVRSGPASPYVRPADECVHVEPRSALRQTAGPNHGEPPPARIAPSEGS